MGMYPFAEFPSSTPPSLRPFSDHPIGGFEKKLNFTPSLMQFFAVFQHFPEKF